MSTKKTSGAQSPVGDEPLGAVATKAAPDSVKALGEACEPPEDVKVVDKASEAPDMSYT